MGLPRLTQDGMSGDMNRLLAVAWLGAIAACDRRPAIDPSDGRGVFEAYCAICHGPDGKPSAMMIARLAVRDLTSSELRARVSPALVEHQVRKGSDNKLMPAFEGAISDPEIKAVAAWVASPEFLRR